MTAREVTQMVVEFVEHHERVVEILLPHGENLSSVVRVDCEDALGPPFDNPDPKLWALDSVAVA